MSSNLDNLVKANQLKNESFDEREFNGLLKSGITRLNDAANKDLDIESQFLLAYNAAHSLALAALRWHGYRADNRYIVFQVLPHTVGVGPEIWRVLAKCHDMRNVAEYEGMLDTNEQMIRELLKATKELEEKVSSLKK